MNGAARPPQYPIAAGAVVIRGGKAAAFLPSGSVELTARRLPLARLFELCDGATCYAEIRSRLGSKAGDLDRLVASLTDAGVLVEADRIVHHALRHAENPRKLGGTPDADAPSELARRAAGWTERRIARRYLRPARFALRRVMERRRSARSFTGAPVSAKVMAALLWACYGCVPARSRERRSPRTIPSAGAAYPLRIGLINLRAVRGLRPGCYVCHFHADGSVGLSKARGKVSEAARAFADPCVLRGAQGVIAVLGDTAHAARKYGNRSVPLALLEAGHAAHSAMLAAADLGVGMVEVGGFYEDRVQSLLADDGRLRPLTTMVFGSARKAASSAGISVEWFDTAGTGYEPPFHTAIARATLPNGEPVVCYGRSRDASQAAERARAEAIERMACASPGRLRYARLDELRNPLEPRAIVAYSDAQYRRTGFPFKPFAADRRYAWTEGRDLASGRRRDVLAECVWFVRFLPASVRSRPYTRVSTSGVAAHPTWEGAVEHALLELIERDAFMRAWLGGGSGAVVHSLPGGCEARIQRLRAAGSHITCKLLKMDPAFVFLVFAQDRARGFTRVTAAAGAEPEDTLDHALMEAEAQIAAVLASPPPQGLRPAEVRLPGDHGRLYAQRRYFRRADFLAAGPGRVAMPTAPHRRGLDALTGRMRRAGLQPVWVPLAGIAPLQAVRVLVPGLVPMTFGWGTEPFGSIGARPAHRPFPHPFS